MVVRVSRLGREGGFMLQADLSKGPTGQSEVRECTGGESGGERGESRGGCSLCLNRSPLSQSPRGSDPELAF